jgi:hypothetical protein
MYVKLTKRGHPTPGATGAAPGSATRSEGLAMYVKLTKRSRQALKGPC